MESRRLKLSSKPPTREKPRTRQLHWWVLLLCWVVSESLRPHGLQCQAACPSLSPEFAQVSDAISPSYPLVNSIKRSKKTQHPFSLREEGTPRLMVWGQHYCGANATQRHTRKENDRLVFLVSSEEKIPQKSSRKQFNSTLKELHTTTKWDVVLECKENLTNGTLIII